MKAPGIRLDRIDITLRGVPPTLVEEAVAGLEAALARRLRGWRPGDDRDLASAALTLPPVHAVPGIDAAGLRALLVEQIARGLGDALDGPGAGTGGER